MLETTGPKTRTTDRVGLACPACEQPRGRVFLELGEVPTNSMVLLDTREQAVNYPKGKLTLAFCDGCGFIFNPDFDPALVDYSQSYESSQAFSPRFNEFAARLAKGLADEYGLAGKKVVEIGCGGGDFLQQVELHTDIKTGIGVDPAADPDHRVENATSHLSFIREFFAEEHGKLQPDFLCCRHTLEHVPDPAAFVRTVRRSLGPDSNTPVFFEVPDTLRVLKEAAFWDVYYEHCSYFTPESLAALFAREGFSDIRTELDFDDQYLLLHCRPSASGSAEADTDYVKTLAEEVETFSDKYRAHIEGWATFLAEVSKAGKRVVVWGGGSKGVAFVNSIPGGERVEVMVDINPAKQETFAAGTGHRIGGPEYLKNAIPDVVLVMNPIYADEIKGTLLDMGIHAEVRTV